MREYPLRITSENDIPDDVLVEHIAVALRDFEFAGKVDVKMARQHPFDGPEVFDDYAPGTSAEGSFSPTDIGARELLENSGIEDPYPLTTRVVDKLKETRRHGND